MPKRIIRFLLKVGPWFVLAFLLAKGKGKKGTGTFLGIPYDFRWPTPRTIRESMWNPGDPRIFTPHVFGWGWSINFYSLAKRLGLVKGSSTAQPPQ